MPQQQQRILLATRFMTERVVMREVLGQMGLTHVRECGDGETALEVLASEPVELVIADNDLPFHSGLELLQHLRGQGRDDLGFVLALEAGNAALAVESSALHARCVVKPFSAQAFQAAVTEALNGGDAATRAPADPKGGS
jgi:two-component system chemotaxis response regulator CheY